MNKVDKKNEMSARRLLLRAILPRGCLLPDRALPLDDLGEPHENALFAVACQQLA